MADAMQLFGQHVYQKAADELGRCQCHGGMAPLSFEAVVLDLERHRIGIGPDQSPVRDRNPMSIPRQIREHGFGPGKWSLGIDVPFASPRWSQEALKCFGVGEVGKAAVEGELAGAVGPQAASPASVAGTVWQVRAPAERSPCGR